jgi:hypothetical protein
MERVEDLPRSAWIDSLSERVDSLSWNVWKTSLGTRGSTPLERVDGLP